MVYRMASYVSPAIREKFESLSVDLKKLHLRAQCAPWQHVWSDSCSWGHRCRRGSRL